MRTKRKQLKMTSRSKTTTGFDLSKSQDVDNLLNLLENGTISDLEEESDDEIVQAIPQKMFVLDMKIFLENMARDRFLQMRNNLHVIDNNSIPQNNTDRFIKVRPLYDSVRKRCLELKLEQILSVDEQIVPFRGKLEVKQYVKGKPQPWGVKIFMICGNQDEVRRWNKISKNYVTIPRPELVQLYNNGMGGVDKTD
ncbi:unnamed protein product [Parnassius apollo]|uniref:(apollo) hypothetical protein n=1 Tax=Parnassius apollo TaxID=110799 RepID=A0A8S3XUF5_PARAO|nr:unnamed protein product [Parnassius apollo]